MGSSTRLSCLPLLTLLFASPALAAEVELWQGLRSGMTREQVEKVVEQPFIKCGKHLQGYYCKTAPYLPFGGVKAALTAMYSEGKLEWVVINHTISRSCRHIRLDLNLPLDKRRKQNELFEACNNETEALVQPIRKQVETALRTKYGPPDEISESDMLYWYQKGRTIVLWDSGETPVDDGYVSVSYHVDDTYGSL